MRWTDVFISLLAAAFGGAAFAQTSDFAPPRGALLAGHIGEVKWEERLLAATSTDGLTFTRTNNIITDQARSPNLVVANGMLYLYYITAVGNRQGTLAVAISSDQGKTWIFKQAEVRNGGRLILPYAPDIRILENGRFRLYFNDARQVPRIVYADGEDGIHFTWAGTLYMRPGRYGSLMIGSLLVAVCGGWHTYLRDVNADFFGVVSHGFSSDGDSFSFSSDPRISFSNGKEPCHPTSAVSLENGRSRFYGSPNQVPGGVRSFVTSDGIEFEPEAGIRLAPDSRSELEKDLVKDAAVVKLSDGSYFMVYVTNIP